MTNMEYKEENRIDSTGSLRVCQNCKHDFTIEPDDFSFYEKIKVPPPTFCPECRMIRRFSFQNTWNLYWRNCDKCGKKTLSLYSKEKKLTIYCQPCWWADDWDGTEYGIDYDPNRSFLEQIKDLIKRTPHSALTSEYLSNKNCEYANALAWSKDCFMVFWADFCDTVYYSTLLNTLKHSSDCIRGFYSELCYESVGLGRCYQTFFSDECDDCINVWFCRNCYNCQNCVGCVNLSGASNCIFNIKYSKDEYEKKVKELNLKSWKTLNYLKDQAFAFWLTKPFRAYHGHSLSYNVTGDYIFTSKNSKESYVLNGGEDCKYCQFVTVVPVKDCFDYSGWGNNAELIYEATVVGENSSKVFFSCECWPDVMDLQYCYWNISGKNNFGCANLKRKKNCILNKEYTKEEFERLKSKIVEEMRLNPYISKSSHKYSYGEFFPPEFSMFPYNKSNAMRFFPKTKEEALAEGYDWDDSEISSYRTSIKSFDLPDTIEQVNESILNEIIECSNCSRAYKIVKGELDLLKKLELPLPHDCPKCRENKRFSRMTMPKLYDRKCDKCGKELRSPYSSDRSEIIYCESCYQKEVY